MPTAGVMSASAKPARTAGAVGGASAGRAAGPVPKTHPVTSGRSCVQLRIWLLPQHDGFLGPWQLARFPRRQAPRSGIAWDVCRILASTKPCDWGNGGQCGRLRLAVDPAQSVFIHPYKLTLRQLLTCPFALAGGVNNRVTDRSQAAASPARTAPLVWVAGWRVRRRWSRSCGRWSRTGCDRRWGRRMAAAATGEMVAAGQEQNADPDAESGENKLGSCFHTARRNDFKTLGSPKPAQ